MPPTPQGITRGPDDTFWFVGAYDNIIGRITTSGVVTTCVAPNSNSGLVDITAGPDGALWFTEYVGGNIGRLTAGSCVITQFPVPTGGNPAWITPGPDGALWFTQQGGNKVSRAPACGLGFSASFASGTLTMNFNLGTAAPATFEIALVNATGPFAWPYATSLPVVAPPHRFTVKLEPVSRLGDHHGAAGVGHRSRARPMRRMDDCEYRPVTWLAPVHPLPIAPMRLKTNAPRQPCHNRRPRPC